MLYCAASRFAGAGSLGSTKARGKVACNKYDFLESLKAIILEAQEPKQIRDLPLRNLGFVLMGSMLLYFTVNPTLPKDVEIEQLADEHAELLLDIILNGIAA